MNRLSLERNKIYQGNLLLVNGSCPIMGRGERDLIPADIHFPEILMRHDAAVALQQILKEIDSADRIVKREKNLPENMWRFRATASTRAGLPLIWD